LHIALRYVVRGNSMGSGVGGRGAGVGGKGGSLECLAGATQHRQNALPLSWRGVVKTHVLMSTYSPTPRWAVAQSTSVISCHCTVFYCIMACMTSRCIPEVAGSAPARSCLLGKPTASVSS
jgi:hypothetical protein